MSSEFDPLSKYFFDETSESEISRLNAQYSYLKSVVGHPRVIPPGIDISHVSRVIDVATGTGAWAIDFASLPEVYKSNVQVFACDISSEKFLKGNEPAVKQITFFQQDVTKPFPEELLGTFDLVNLSFLSYALTSQGWEKALQNLRGLLRPGGHLIIRDGEHIMFNHERPPPPEGQEPDVAACMQGTSIVANVNRIFSGGALRRGFLVSVLSQPFLQILETASLRVVSSRRVEVPFGNNCDFYTGIDGTSLSKLKAVTIENCTRLINMISKFMVNNGGLELANGTIILSEEERQVLMGEVARFISEGGSTFVSEWIIERPF